MKARMAHASFPYYRSTSSLLEIVLHHKGNITHAIFLCIMKDKTTTIALPTNTLHHKGKFECDIFIYSTSTSVLPKTALQCEGNLTLSCFLFFIRTKAFPRNKFHHEG